MDYQDVVEWEYFSKVLLIVVYLQSFLLISDRPFLALKFQGFGVKENWNKYLLIAVGVGMFLGFGIVSFLPIYGVYVLLSLFTIRKQNYR